MAYTKTNWVNGYTPLNASNMNKIEEGVFNNDTFLSSLDIRVEDLEGKIGQGGINSVNVSGNGNALTNASYNPSTKILNLEKNNTFALDSDNEKSLYHLGAYDSVSGNIITRQTGYLLIDGVNIKCRAVKFDYYLEFNFISPINESFSLAVSAFGVSTTIIFDNNNGFYFNPSDNYRLALKATTQTVRTVDEWNVYFSQNPIVIQYKLATSYTEEIIEGQPLTTLDQSGSQWVRTEWEKGLNLLYIEYENHHINASGVIESDTNWDVGNLIKVSPNTEYTISGNTNEYFHLFYYGSSQNFLSYVSSFVKGDNVKYTFTTPSNCYYLRAQVGSTNSNIMLNKGSHAYPYQEYRGGIARESQLIKVKTFSGDASTFSDFTSWIDSNNERVISIMYYERSSGGNNYYNVIFGSDGSVYKYIDSEGTLNNVTLSSGSEGADILKIYYI